MRLLICLALSLLSGLCSLLPCLSAAAAAPPSAECAVCLQTVATLDGFLQRGGLDGFSSFLFTECLWQSYPDTCSGADPCFSLCSGFMKEYAPLIAQRLINDTLSSSVLCAELQLCPQPQPPPPPSRAVPVPSDLSDLAGQPKWAMWQRTAGLGVIAHVSDMHVDHLYAAGSSTDCGLPLCCRQEWGLGTDGSNSAGLWGEYNCDTPEQTVQSMLDFLNRTTPRPDFLIYTGDDPAHDIWEQSRANQLQAIAYTSGLLHAYFPDIPVFQTLGNHEAFPSDQYGGPALDSWLYSQLPRLWAPDLADDAKRTVAYGGYYQNLVRPGLRVVSINSNIYAGSDLYVDPRNPVDVSQQMNWLEDVLSQLQQRGEKAIIIAHQSPSSWYAPFSRRFNALLTRYQHHILNLFYGHTHHSEVQTVQLYTDNSTTPPTPHTVGYIGGSVTPYTQTNPGYQSYEYSRPDISNASVTSLVTDYTVYWIDLPQANAAHRADWQPHFRARRDAGLADLSPASWFSLAESIKANGSRDAFRNLFVSFRRGYYNSTAGVDARDWGCEMESDSDATYAACYARMGLQAPARDVSAECDALGPDKAESVIRKVAEMRADNARRQAVSSVQRQKERAEAS